MKGAGRSGASTQLGYTSGVWYVRAGAAMEGRSVWVDKGGEEKRKRGPARGRVLPLCVDEASTTDVWRAGAA